MPITRNVAETVGIVTVKYDTADSSHPMKQLYILTTMIRYRPVHTSATIPTKGNTGDTVECHLSEHVGTEGCSDN